MRSAGSRGLSGPEVIRFVDENFVPVKIHVKEQPRTFDRFDARWTPTQIVLDSNGVERHRIEGFLPVDDFLAQLELGLARLEFEQKHFDDAEAKFRSVCEHHPRAGVAPEACYWAGVSEYKATNRPDPLKKTARLLEENYPESEWARKASVWA
jgi:hypothetical protein